jgi:uncharacterized protein YkwD
MVIRRIALPALLIFCAGLSACAAFNPPNNLAGAAGGAVDKPISADLQIAATAEPTEEIAQPTPTAAPTLPPQPVETVVTLQQPYGPLEMELLSKMNQWRLEIGLWPFRSNDLLTQLAMKQAQYLITIPDGPSDYHADANGKYPVERGFEGGWPAYNNPGQTAIGEVAYEGTVDGAIDYWHNSPIHNKTVTEPGFREIGVAAVPGRYGNLFIVLVGGRPDTLPALIDPASGQMYLTSERYRWRNGNRIQEVTQVQVLASAESEVSAECWLPWNTTIAMPHTLGPNFAVAYSDGTHTVINPVDVATDIAWLPDNLVTTTLTVTTPPPGGSGGRVVVAEENTPPTEIATEAPTEPPAPTPEIGNGLLGGQTPDITLIYGPYSLSIWNNPPGDPVDLTTLSLVQGGMTLPASAWETPYLGVPLDRFTVGSCLQTWDFNELDPGAPAGCFVRASAINLRTGRFWLNGPFDVVWNGSAQRTCPAGSATCEVILK